MEPIFNITLCFVAGRYELLVGVPSDHGLSTTTAAHIYTLGSEQAVFWTVGCDLTGDEIRTLAERLLANWNRTS